MKIIKIDDNNYIKITSILKLIEYHYNKEYNEFDNFCNELVSALFELKEDELARYIQTLRCGNGWTSQCEAMRGGEVNGIIR